MVHIPLHLTDAQIKNLSDKELGELYRRVTQDRRSETSGLLPIIGAGPTAKQAWKAYEIKDEPWRILQLHLFWEFEDRNKHFFRGTHPGFIGTDPNDPKRLRLWYEIRAQHSRDHYENRTEPRIWAIPNKKMTDEIVAQFDRDGYPYRRDGNIITIDPADMPKRGWMDKFYLYGGRHEHVRVGKGGKIETFVGIGQGVEILRELARAEKRTPVRRYTRRKRDG